MKALKTHGKYGFGVLFNFTFPLIVLEIYSQYRKVAKKLETLEYDSLWFNDHFWTFPEPSGKPVFETLALMSAIAADTETINLGTLVLAQSYRNPALMAKAAATIDQISNGRLIFGYGAGWYQGEYRGYGYDYPSAGTRLNQLDESIRIIKAMWTEDRPSFEGKYYQIENAECFPKPIQKPYPPILIGGSGEKKTLRIVAKYADACNIAGGSLDVFRHKFAVLEEHCKAINRPSSEIRKTINVFVHIGSTEEEVKQEVQWYKNNHPREHIRKQSLEEYLAGRVHGTPDQCINGIQNFLDTGAEYLILIFPRLGDLKGPELFAKEVMPSFL
ncbi:MAG: LLM class F420-dependent oxidoreductase [Promethearchaeota archaeon]